MIGSVVVQFESCTFPPADFHHEQHVFVAWSYLRNLPLALALERFSVNLKRFATEARTPSLYHETITWAFVILTHERMRRAPDDDWDAFRIANPDLLTWKPCVLDRYYRPETLRSDLAKSTFILPDRPLYEGLR